MDKRQQYVKASGIVDIKPSGAVCISWPKAVRSRLFQDQMKAMQRIRLETTGNRSE